ncbi:hypothetical protein DPMN_102740 [Dreissena polymorpha]|uniref:Uncharacterized protein n=1 Tax=Dreissena polymorpha TaxID=45954 RepID=A0A9D4R9C4_DREPO|nr:hypothetical protein DPMN_102740 [Dreissena polymorpha]
MPAMKRQKLGIHLRKNARSTGGHVFQATGTIFELFQNIIGTNLQTKFHDDRPYKIHSVNKEKCHAPLGGHVFPPTGTIFELIQDIIGTNHLAKFHDDRTINVASRVLTRKNARPLLIWGTDFAHLRGTNILFHDPRQNCPLPSSHVIQLTGTNFELNSRIKKTNVLTKFHDDWEKKLISRVFTRENCHYIHIEKNAPPTGGHPNRENCHYIHIEKNAPPTGGHVFFTDLDHFRTRPRHHLNQLLTRKTAPPTGGHDFQRIGTTFKLNQDIIKTNILTNFELGRYFIGTKLLTKFHEDGTRNQMLTDGRTDIRRTKTGHKSSPEQSELPKREVLVAKGNAEDDNAEDDYDKNDDADD